MSRRASFGRADPDGELFLRPTRVRDELVARDEAVAHARDAFGVRGDVRLVRDHHDGLAEVVEALKDRKDLRARSRVQVSRRLVREDHRRVVQERARDRDALLLTAGELARAVVDPVAEADLLERSERALPPLFAVAAVDERQLDVLDRVQSREQVVGLEHEADVLVADPGQLIVGELSDVLAREHIGAAVGHVEAAEHVHERRLSRARRAHDRDELRGADVEVHAAERIYRDLTPDAVGLRDAAKLDDALDHRPTMTPGPPPPKPPPPAPGRAVAVARAAGRTARSPSATPLITSVVVSFEMPNTTSVSTASPSFRICK